MNHSKIRYLPYLLRQCCLFRLSSNLLHLIATHLIFVILQLLFVWVEWVPWLFFTLQFSFFFWDFWKIPKNDPLYRENDKMIIFIFFKKLSEGKTNGSLTFHEKIVIFLLFFQSLDFYSYKTNEIEIDGPISIVFPQGFKNGQNQQKSIG